jgi:hypothetical protein
MNDLQGEEIKERFKKVVGGRKERMKGGEGEN